MHRLSGKKSCMATFGEIRAGIDTAAGSATYTTTANANGYITVYPNTFAGQVYAVNDMAFNGGGIIKNSSKNMDSDKNLKFYKVVKELPQTDVGCVLVSEFNSAYRPVSMLYVKDGMEDTTISQKTVEKSTEWFVRVYKVVNKAGSVKDLPTDEARKVAEDANA